MNGSNGFPKTLLSDIDGTIGASLPFACQDSANTKAACRFLSNERVDEAHILSGHFQATASCRRRAPLRRASPRLTGKHPAEAALWRG